ncbi:transcriptional regulator [Frankia sp. EI5c]|nr:transcriptional regulator [Frankia sp. EI5c]
MTRSRAALLAAAVRLVSERGTTAIAVTDLADTANVSRQLVYLQFGDRESLFVEAAVDLVRRELLPELAANVGDQLGVADQVDIADRRQPILVTARHFARHRSFYRAMLTGSCAFAMTRALDELFSGFQRPAIRLLFGDVDGRSVDDLTAFLASGTGGLINNWLIDGEDPLDPEALADRLLGILSFLFAHPRHAHQLTHPQAAHPHPRADGAHP